MKAKTTVTIPVRVQPRGSRNEIGDVVDGRLRIKTTAPPTDGRANVAVIKQVAKAFGVPPSRVSLKNGAAGRNKTLVIERPEIIPDWLADTTFR